MKKNRTESSSASIIAKGARSVAANRITESIIHTGDINIFNPQQSARSTTGSNIKSIFIHYFNDQMLKNYGLDLKYDTASLVPTLINVTRVAFLLTDNKLIIPTIDTAQSDYFKMAFNAIKELLDTQTIFFAGSEVSPNAWRFHKVKHFRAVKLYPQYFKEDLQDQLSQTAPYWIKRTISTTQDIANRWVASLLRIDENRELNYDSRRFLYAYNQLKDNVKFAKYISELYKVPRQLDGQAFLWNVIQAQQLISFGRERQITYPIELALGFMWISSHIEEYDAAIFSYMPMLGACDCGISDEYPQSTYRYSVVARILNMYGLLKLIELIDNESLILLKNLESFLIFKRKLLIPKYKSLAFASADAQHLNLIERSLIKTSQQVIKKTKLRTNSDRSVINCIINVVESISNVICKLQPDEESDLSG